jgi:hypothetical protein
MSGDQKTVQPWGDAFAPDEQGSGEQKKTIWVELGPVWQGESGALTMTLRVDPLHWRDYAAERRIVIRKRDAKNNAGNGNNDRGNNDRNRSGNRR